MEEALVISTSYRRNKRPILVIKQNLYHAQKLYERISTLLPESECALFGAEESLRVESIADSPEMTAIKVETMSSLLQNPSQVVVTCPSAMLRFLPLPEDFRNGCILLHAGDETDMEDLKRKLLAGGYRQAAHIDQPLTFACRGGIVDIYSINMENPVRIEFFDTEIDSIRTFDAATQKTIENISEASIVPASDVIFTDEQVSEICSKGRDILKQEENEASGDIEADFMAMEAHVFERRMYPYMALLNSTASIIDYMNKPLLVWSDEQSVRETIKSLKEESVSYIQEMVQENKLLPKYTVWQDETRIVKGLPSIKEDPFIDNISDIEEVHLPNELLETKLKMISGTVKTVAALPEKEYTKVINTCIAAHIPYHLLTEDEDPEDGLNLYLSSLAEGFRIGKEDLEVYTADELFEVHHHKGRYEKKFNTAEVIHGYEELHTGDYIVHATYGVGQFLGLETKTVQGVKRDFLKVVYKGNAELLIPLEQFRLVRKFVSRDGVIPRLNKLGSGDWEKTREKLQKNVEEIAGRLLDLYSTRETHIGYAFSKDTEYTKKFNDDFPYDLTADQETAVEDIRKDMESDRPMDRLVCGDVGFGKTEVAVRASFKAVCDHKQVAVLCPTTILSQQHFATFTGRYRNYPVTIRVLNRFVTKSETGEVLKQLKDGTVDIVIGTHRLLSKDIKFKDLGLLIVDEEQRFGVEHKEKIKELKQGVDVLTLSATPIPRTLQMSLVGIRQLSQLETPPLNRYSVQTYVVEKNDRLIREAIEKELARKGQIFYLNNNIAQLYNTQRKIQNMIPDVRIGTVHGQMSREEIEDVMLKVYAHEIDILICTTIVENGIDIPNVNTILVENAQDFGLAQIYQIKGRVGRSDRIAYAYLMIPPRRQLTEISQKRLQSIKEFARLGSGYKIAMRDLTIRGAGDLLGPSQSGFIDTVGIDMYIEMLEEAIAAKKKGVPAVHKEVKPKANIQKTSYIPKDFAPDDYDKLDMYQRIDANPDSASLEAYERDVIDQYGHLPKEVEALFTKKKLDLLLEDPIVHSYRELRNGSEITFSALFSKNVDGVLLFESFTKLSKDITIRYTGGCIIAMIPKMKNDMDLAAACIKKAKESVRK